MNIQNQVTRIVVAVVALLLLAGLATIWPIWVGSATAQSAVDASEASAIIGDAISYQGRLTDSENNPLTGTYTMRFQIFDRQTGGPFIWNSGDKQIEVKDGLFEVRFDIDTDIFNGMELWLSQTVNGELLMPRQEILPAPMAHTLRPGAIIKGTAAAFPNNYVLDVQMNNDTFTFNRGAIYGQSTTGNAIYGLAANGRAIYGQTEDGYAVYGFDGGSEANRGYAGYFFSTNGVGVYGYSNGNRAHPNILAPGVYGQSNQGVGVYGRGDTSNSYSFNNEGGYFEGGKGLYARGTDPSSESGYGARIFSSQYRGMYVQGSGGYFDAYFGGSGGISTNGVLDRSASSQSLVVNSGSVAIEPGDLVAMVGVSESPENGQMMLAVAKVDATNRHAVIGVAKEAVAAEIITLEDASETVDLAPVSGSSAPNSFLIVITDGLAPAVNIGSVISASATEGGESWAIGQKMAVSTGGEIVSASGEVERIIVGKVAGPLDPSNNTIPLFVDID
jgi:hypothetical protein